MNEHSNEPHDQYKHIIDDAFMKDLEAKSLVIMYMSKTDESKFITMWNSEQPSSVESLANMIVEMVAGDMGEKLLSSMKDKCVLEGKGYLFDEFMDVFSVVSNTFIAQAEQHAAEENLNFQNEIVVPPDQTFIL